MTDLEKDLAIYNEMLKIANEVFDNATASNESLRKYMNENGGVVSINEITKARSEVFTMINASPCCMIVEELCTVEVGTFKCSFPPDSVFRLLKYWKSLAKVKGDIVFTYEEKEERKLAGTMDVTFDNPSNAKLLVNSVSDDELRPSMCNVLVEVDAASGDISFVATDGHELSVISNNPAETCKDYESSGSIYQALFSKDDWKRICDYARKQKSPVRFEVYERERNEEGDMELNDTMVAVLGDTKVRSRQDGRYPKWKSVLPDLSKMQHAVIAESDVSAARKWLSNYAYSEYESVIISVYKGSDLIYFDNDVDWNQNDCKTTATFRLTKPSDVTIGTRLAFKKIRKKKFSGFWFQECGCAVVDDENCDFMLIMPTEGCKTPYKSEREVHAMKAEIVELQCA